MVIGGMMYFTRDRISYMIDADTRAERWKNVRDSRCAQSDGSP
jgi:hypothetical protein